MSELFAPVCSITTTQRRRFFWAAWWTKPPARAPFVKPDASDGGAPSREVALAAAEARAGTRLVLVDAGWAKAWMRVLRGQAPWPSSSSVPGRAVERRSEDAPASIYDVLGVPRSATLAELKAAFRARALTAHPDHGGSDEAFRALVRAFREAEKRAKRPRPRRRPE